MAQQDITQVKAQTFDVCDTVGWSIGVAVSSGRAWRSV
jgi:hypothetical protein